MLLEMDVPPAANLFAALAMGLAPTVAVTNPPVPEAWPPGVEFVKFDS